MGSSHTLAPADTADALRGTGFRHGDGELTASFRTGDFARGARLVAAIADAAEKLNHHPDLTLSYGAVGVRLSSHDAGGVTERDLELARAISVAAGVVGADVSPAG